MRSFPHSTPIPFRFNSSRFVELLHRSNNNQLGGIDLDVYYPTSQEDLKNYVRFVREASRAWRQAGLEVSVTWHPHRLPLPEPIFDMVNKVHLMAYDMVEQTGQHHSSYANTQKGIRSLLQQGCPPHKIWLGIPMYGRKLNNPGEAEAFGILFDRLQSRRVKKSQSDFDSTNAHDGFEWDSPDRIRVKMDYAHSKQLGGVFFWELGQDYQDPEQAPGGLLLEAASQHRRKLLLSPKTEAEL